jgi:hypothetical protein
MRNIHVFSLVVMILASFMTWNALGATPLKVHVLNNLDARETKLALKALSRLGYQPVMTPLFTESSHAVVITKTLGPGLQTASVSFEVLELKQNETLPKTLFEIKESPSLETLMNQAPKPDQVRLNPPEAIKPVAAIN